MRTVIVTVIGISSIFLVIMIHQTVNTESIKEQEIETALASAMYQTMSEVMEKNSYGIENRNEMMAAFLQAMIQRMDEDIDLTVLVHKFQYDTGVMDIEAIGEFMLPGQKRKKVSVRRQLAFVRNNN